LQAVGSLKTTSLAAKTMRLVKMSNNISIVTIIKCRNIEFTANLQALES